MISNKLIILAISAFLILTYSCNKTDDTAEIIEKWQTQNKSYFTNMKDSAGYVLYEIPTDPAGYNFYYKITTQGNQTGGSPLSTDSVYVNFRGRTVDGKIFAQTYSKNSPIGDITAQPHMFKLNQLLPGWIESLKLMKVGEIRTTVLPQELAYGAYYMPSMPFSTLRFDIQLISYKSAAN